MTDIRPEREYRTEGVNFGPPADALAIDGLHFGPPVNRLANVPDHHLIYAAGAAVRGRAAATARGDHATARALDASLTGLTAEVHRRKATAGGKGFVKPHTSGGHQVKGFWRVNDAHLLQPGDVLHHRVTGEKVQVTKRSKDPLSNYRTSGWHGTVIDPGQGGGVPKKKRVVPDGEVQSGDWGHATEEQAVAHHKRSNTGPYR